MTQVHSNHFPFSPNVLPPGSSLLDGDYTLLEPLGQGGFGITYLARDMAKRRAVAIKEFFPAGCIRRGPEVCPTGAWTETTFETARRRFLREAQTLRQFAHPGIVRISHTFEENHTAYMVMDYLGGKSLRAILDEQGSLSAEETVDYALQICEALEVLHHSEVLHLDVKPANIILGAEGRAVLIDFGAARGLVLGHTASPTVVVTPGYAPLEQYDEEAERGPFTDIYSLSATLYHLLTGIAPVSATGRAAGVPLTPLGEFNSSFPLGLQRAVMDGMELDRRDRPASVEAFRRLLNGETPPRPFRSVVKPVRPLSTSEGIDYVPQPTNVAPVRPPLLYHPRFFSWVFAFVVACLFLAVVVVIYYLSAFPSAEVTGLSDAPTQSKARPSDANKKAMGAGTAQLSSNDKMTRSLETASEADVTGAKQDMSAQGEELIGDDVSGWRRGGPGSVKIRYNIEETGSSTIPFIGRVIIKGEQPITDTFSKAADAARAPFTHTEPSSDTLTYSYQGGTWKWQSSAE